MPNAPVVGVGAGTSADPNPKVAGVVPNPPAAGVDVEPNPKENAVPGVVGTGAGTAG